MPRVRPPDQSRRAHREAAADGARRIDVFSPEEVHALVRAAACEQDAALFLTAAFTGLRQGELIALRWRDVDFPGSYIRVTASYTNGELSTPKSGKVRSVPMAPEVGAALARLGQRDEYGGEDDVVFVGLGGGHLDASALLRRDRTALRAAGVRPLRFHDLRHTFGTRVIAEADIRRVQEGMGHADVQTTMRYLHYAPRHDDAALVERAFATKPAARGDDGCGVTAGRDDPVVSTDASRGLSGPTTRLTFANLEDSRVWLSPAGRSGPNAAQEDEPGPVEGLLVWLLDLASSPRPSHRGSHPKAQSTVTFSRALLRAASS
jgi:hypothetical protein